MSTQAHWIISTDLDGTLLDHQTYSYKAALPAIKESVRQNIPIVFNTSKTLAESIELQKEMGFIEPFIVENGAAVYLPKTLYKNYKQLIKSKTCEENEKYYIKKLGLDREKILTILETLRSQYNYEFTGFSDLSIEQLIDKTGLNITQANNAMSRYYSEPISWSDSKVQLLNFQQQLKQNGLNLLKGGRFYHIQGHNNKGEALLWLKQLYQQFYHDYYPNEKEENDDFKVSDVRVIALGDGENDIDMLEAADKPIIIRSNFHNAPKVSNIKTTISKAIGPLGWNNEILNLITN